MVAVLARARMTTEGMKANYFAYDLWGQRFHAAAALPGGVLFSQEHGRVLNRAFGGEFIGGIERREVEALAESQNAGNQIAPSAGYTVQCVVATCARVGVRC